MGHAIHISAAFRKAAAEGRLIRAKESLRTSRIHLAYLRRRIDAAQGESYELDRAIDALGYVDSALEELKKLDGRY